PQRGSSGVPGRPVLRAVAAPRAGEGPRAHRHPARAAHVAALHLGPRVRSAQGPRAPPGPRRGRRGRAMTTRWEVVATWALVLGGTLGAWSLAAATLPLPDYYLPPPSAVLAALVDLTAKGILPTYVFESARRIVLAT